MLDWKQIKEELLTPITALNDTTSVRALIKDKIMLIGQAYQLSESELRGTPEYGPKSLTIMREYIKATGLSPLIKYTPHVKGDDVRVMDPTSKRWVSVDDPIERFKDIALDALPKFEQRPREKRLFGNSGSWEYKAGERAPLTKAFDPYRDRYDNFLEQHKETFIDLASPQLLPRNVVPGADIDAMLVDVLAHLRAGEPSPEVQAFTKAADDVEGQKLLRAVVRHVLARGPNKDRGPV